MDMNGCPEISNHGCRSQEEESDICLAVLTKSDHRAHEMHRCESNNGSHAILIVGTRRSLKNSGSHIDASHSRQPLVKGERLVRYEVNAVILDMCETYEPLVYEVCIILCEIQLGMAKETSRHQSSKV